MKVFQQTRQQRGARYFTWRPVALFIVGVVALGAAVSPAAVDARTVADAVAIYGADARARLKAKFASAGAEYPPSEITLLAMKQESILELWTETATTRPRFIASYQIRALSGSAGPKLREGDRQVPEGFYEIVGLNPNSRYHLSMKLNYPNAFDLKHARLEGRDQPGSNIFLHGKAVSIGCLAMGDDNIEELFVAAADIGRANINVIVSPLDPRAHAMPTIQEPSWVARLYARLSQAFARYQR
ncbi:MAG: hypothetical protein K0U93_22220 [Gammaproteobacteria bacterium]|nr:hypothetical protein [Gammaproteobacteria bacterium]